MFDLTKSYKGGEFLAALDAPNVPMRILREAEARARVAAKDWPASSGVVSAGQLRAMMGPSVDEILRGGFVPTRAASFAAGPGSDAESERPCAAAAADQADRDNPLIPIAVIARAFDVDRAAALKQAKRRKVADFVGGCAYVRLSALGGLYPRMSGSSRLSTILAKCAASKRKLPSL